MKDSTTQLNSLSVCSGKDSITADKLENYEQIFPFLLNNVKTKSSLAGADLKACTVKTVEVALFTSRKYGFDLIAWPTEVHPRNGQRLNHCYLFNGKWWDYVHYSFLANFLAGVAEKAGMDHDSAWIHTFKSELIKQLVSAHANKSATPQKEEYMSRIKGDSEL